MPRLDIAVRGRRDLSSFLVHLTRDLPAAGARDNLVSILRRGRIEARTPFGYAKTIATRKPSLAVSQSVVCFSEAPLSEVARLAGPMPGRQYPLAEYGVAFKKSVARARGVNPVWYFEIGSAVDTALQNLFNQAVVSESPMLQPMWSLFPFMEGTGRLHSGRMKEFSWEREWRHVGDFEFERQELALVIAPEPAHRALTGTYGVHCVDVNWTFDRMLDQLLSARRG
jgi:hypothetical protein